MGVCIADVASSYITLGVINEEHREGQQTAVPTYTNLKTLLSQVKPMEIVYDPSSTPQDVVKILKSSYLRPVMSPLTNS
jgi:DNA mismatch repair ATPase MutS